MVKQELAFFKYLLKSHFMLLALPLIFIIVSFFLKEGSIFSEGMMLMAFPTLLFPIIAILGPIGSIHHKELFITFPINLLLVGVCRPLGIILFYSCAFTFALKISDRYEWMELLGAFVACFLYMILTELCLIMFKNTALSMVIPICYVIYGLFTTGSGLGVFYLSQWGRANPDVMLNNSIVTQIALILLFIPLCPYYLKRRNQYFV